MGPGMVPGVHPDVAVSHLDRIDKLAYHHSLPHTVELCREVLRDSLSLLCQIHVSNVHILKGTGHRFPDFVSWGELPGHLYWVVSILANEETPRWRFRNGGVNKNIS
jgi:hypothetical protein